MGPRPGGSQPSPEGLSPLPVTRSRVLVLAPEQLQRTCSGRSGDGARHLSTLAWLRSCASLWAQAGLR